MIKPMPAPWNSPHRRTFWTWRRRVSQLASLARTNIIFGWGLNGESAGKANWGAQHQHRTFIHDRIAVRLLGEDQSCTVLDLDGKYELYIRINAFPRGALRDYFLPRRKNSFIHAPFLPPASLNPTKPVQKFTATFPEDSQPPSSTRGSIRRPLLHPQPCGRSCPSQ